MATTSTDSGWMTEAAAAEYLGRSVWTLRQWRGKGQINTKRGMGPIPPYYRRAGAIWYTRDDLDNWIRGGRVTGGEA